MCWCPDLTIDVHQCPEGRLFIPSESSSKIVRGLHRFRYLWSYTWPKSLLAKIQLILCFAIMISARVCNVLVPYYSKLVVDKALAFISTYLIESLGLRISKGLHGHGLWDKKNRWSSPWLIKANLAYWIPIAWISRSWTPSWNSDYAPNDVFDKWTATEYSSQYLVCNSTTRDCETSSSNDLQPFASFEIRMAC